MKCQQPLPNSEFVVGPAAKVLARFEFAEFLRTLQNGVERRAPSWVSRGQDLVWFAGGCVRAMREGEAPRDLDVFFPNSFCLDAVLATIKENFDHQVLSTNELVIKLNVLIDDVAGRFTAVDLVKRYALNPLATARAMDFVCCSAALSMTTYARHVRFESETAERVLTVNAPWRPRSSLKRAGRFEARGWRISDEERAKLKALAEDPYLPDWDFDNTGYG